MSRIAPYPLRMAPETREFLEQEAEKSKRSLQQEILHRLDKFQQIERLLSSSKDNDDMYMQVASMLRASRALEEKEKEIGALNEKVNLLANALKISEADRFITISRNVAIIEKSLANIIRELPPTPDPIKKPT